MGYTILMQWSFNPPNRTPLADIIITRILEHYNLTHPLRSTIQFRTFRSTSAPSDSLSHTAPSSSYAGKLLTTIAYSQPVQIQSQARSDVSSMARDDVTYVVLDDRGEGRKVFEQEQAGVEKQERGRAADSSSTKRGGKSQDQSQDKGGKANANEKGPSSGNGNGDGGNDGDDPEIEILENDPNLYAPVETDTKSNESVNAQSSRTRTRRRPRQYQTLAVRPAASVLPLLTNLLSPFVMGISKSARAAASTTSQHPTPTPLSGTPNIVQTLSFPALPPPHPPLLLSVHAIPSNTGTVILEGEWGGANADADAVDSDPSKTGKGETEMVEMVLKEFLEGCLPEGVGGERKFVSWWQFQEEEDEGRRTDGREADGMVVDDDDDHDANDKATTGWEGIERNRRVTQMLARTLRESGVI